MGLEVRRDAFTAAKVGAAVCVLFVIVAGCVGSIADRPGAHTHSIALGLAAALGFAACVRAVIRESRRADVAPNLLLTHFGPDVETDGVQWVGTQGPCDLRAPSFVCVHLQNCVEAPRRVQVSLRDDLVALAPRHASAAPVADRARSGRGAVALMAPSPPRGRRHMTLSNSTSSCVRAAGSGAARVPCGKSASTRVSLLTQVLGAMGGYAVWGGGFWFRFENRVPSADEAAPLGAPSTTVVWAMASASIVDTTLPGDHQT